MFRKLFREIYFHTNKETKKIDFDWERYQKTAKEQFLRLKGMGISIPIKSI